MLDDSAYLSTQNGTLRIDKFTHCLLVKCTTEVLMRYTL